MRDHTPQSAVHHSCCSDIGFTRLYARAWDSSDGRSPGESGTETVPWAFLRGVSYGSPMRGSNPPHGRLHTGLTDTQWVTVTAIALALGAFVLTSLESSPLPAAEFGAEFLLSLSILDTAFVYGHWPVEYGPEHAVAWALLSGLLTAGAFVGVHGVVLSWAGATTAGVAAFLTAVGLGFGAAVLYARLQ